MSLRVGIVSLGCPRNLVDSESILAGLKQKHISITDLDNAELVMVNTCAFIKEAKEESIQTILHLSFCHIGSLFFSPPEARRSQNNCFLKMLVRFLSASISPFFEQNQHREHQF